MIAKDDKLPSYSSEHAAQLNTLSQRPEFKALIALFRLEENNIMIRASQTDTEDVNCAVKLAKYQGRLIELRNLMSIFDRVRKKDPAKDE